jgi:DNA invertase Pin-like site-specific DNA recombinase
MSETRILLNEYATRDDVKVVKVYDDRGMSGMSLPNQRPGLTTLLDDARNGVFTILYISGVDRLGRKPEHVIEIISQLQAVGVRVKVYGQDELTIAEQMKGLLESFNEKPMQVKSAKRSTFRYSHRPVIR